MGASFLTTTIASTERAAVKAAFKDMQDADRYENGHSYSGGFGSAGGLEFRDEKTFPTDAAAYDWLLDNAEKWKAALAVRLTDDTGKHVGYVVGAMCAS